MHANTMIDNVNINSRQCFCPFDNTAEKYWYERLAFLLFLTETGQQWSKVLMSPACSFTITQQWRRLPFFRTLGKRCWDSLFHNLWLLAWRRVATHLKTRCVLSALVLVLTKKNNIIERLFQFFCRHNTQRPTWPPPSRGPRPMPRTPRAVADAPYIVAFITRSSTATMFCTVASTVIQRLPGADCCCYVEIKHIHISQLAFCNQFTTHRKLQPISQQCCQSHWTELHTHRRILACSTLFSFKCVGRYHHASTI